MTQASSPHKLKLADRLNAAEAKTLHADIAACEGGDVELDASDVSFLSGLCLQVLLSANTAWQTSGHSLKLVDVSDFTSQTLDALQLSHLYTQEA